MSQTVDKIKPSYPLFRDEDYKANLSAKRNTVEEVADQAKLDEVFEWTTTVEYQELNFAREALTVNPAKACQPLGAVLCALGFEKTLPYVHGSQGCVAYFRTYFNRHFKEPVACVSDSMTAAARRTCTTVLRTPRRCTSRNASRSPPPAWPRSSVTTSTPSSATPRRQVTSRRSSRPRSRTPRASSAATPPAGTTCSRAFSAISR